ncbi:MULTISPECIES: acetylglutamate kinase [Flavobacteriaceae]|uniref:Acetylglutamate kinase n=2 Tax=Flavobacteriaceae TaxID=49546 RepID=A0A4Y8AU46_9FLAO|nr:MULTISPECIES: acetylglutamate kinase [Flavobacteriaceae]TEW75003.1 acetylglutamate kinase [Gramella jeungdoensis]GGK42369.1 acetylglutamate kinase [Lutibacter litoralis]
MKNQILKIVKIGGNVINNEDALRSFLKDFAALEGPKILVHGGGRKASEVSAAMGLEPKMINGRRVTDEATVEVVTMVYAGLLNKKIIANLQSFGCNAMGLSGADANCILAHKRIVKDIDYGFAGDVDAINSEIIGVLIKNNVTPVFCAITHDKNGQLLNTNADTIASEVAIGMSNLYKTELNFVFELKGVLEDIEDKNSVIEQINSEKYEQLVVKGVIADGMLPKMHNCFNSLEKGVDKVKIGDASLVKSSTKLYTTLSL